jgi:hypothetical protein
VLLRERCLKRVRQFPAIGASEASGTIRHNLSDWETGKIIKQSSSTCPICFGRKSHQYLRSCHDGHDSLRLDRAEIRCRVIYGIEMITEND